MKLTSGWYSTIPQNIGYKPNWNSLCIDTDDKLSRAQDLLDLLGDVKGVQTSFQAGSTDWDRYDSIGADLEVLDRSDPMWKKLERHALESRAANHHQYRNMKIRRIFKLRVKSHKDDSWFDPGKVGNVQNLYHGSRNCNMLGISSKGLLMRPPGVVITGSMLGCGLYFGSNSSKSLQYAQGGWGGTRNIRSNCYLFVTSVALGKIKEYTTAQSQLNSPPYGYHSVKGVAGVQLINDEYVIYTTRQHRLDYILDIDPGC
jgi:poly [ADP-ribose] polymerase